MHHVKINSIYFVSLFRCTVKQLHTHTHRKHHMNRVFSFSLDTYLQWNRFTIHRILIVPHNCHEAINIGERVIMFEIRILEDTIRINSKWSFLCHISSHFEMQKLMNTKSQWQLIRLFRTFDRSCQCPREKITYFARAHTIRFTHKTIFCTHLPVIVKTPKTTEKCVLVQWNTRHGSKSIPKRATTQKKSKKRRVFIRNLCLMRLTMLLFCCPYDKF